MSRSHVLASLLAASFVAGCYAAKTPDTSVRRSSAQDRQTNTRISVSAGSDDPTDARRLDLSASLGLLGTPRITSLSLDGYPLDGVEKSLPSDWIAGAIVRANSLPVAGWVDLGNGTDTVAVDNRNAVVTVTPLANGAHINIHVTVVKQVLDLMMGAPATATVTRDGRQAIVDSSLSVVLQGEACVVTLAAAADGQDFIVSAAVGGSTACSTASVQSLTLSMLDGPTFSGPSPLTISSTSLAAGSHVFKVVVEIFDHSQPEEPAKSVEGTAVLTVTDGAETLIGSLPGADDDWYLSDEEIATLSQHPEVLACEAAAGDPLSVRPYLVIDDVTNEPSCLQALPEGEF